MKEGSGAGDQDLGKLGPEGGGGKAATGLRGGADREVIAGTLNEHFRCEVADRAGRSRRTNMNVNECLIIGRLRMARVDGQKESLYIPMTT